MYGIKKVSAIGVNLKELSLMVAGVIPVGNGFVITVLEFLKTIGYAQIV